MIRVECKKECHSVRMEVLSREYEKIHHFVRMIHAKDEIIDREMKDAEGKLDEMVEYLCKHIRRY